MSKDGSSIYVCPQCGPAPEGADAHAERAHTWPPRVGSACACQGCGDTFSSEGAFCEDCLFDEPPFEERAGGVA